MVLSLLELGLFGKIMCLQILLTAWCFFPVELRRKITSLSYKCLGWTVVKTCCCCVSDSTSPHHHRRWVFILSLYAVASSGKFSQQYLDYLMVVSYNHFACINSRETYYSLFIVRKPHFLLRINGEWSFLRINNLY